jgi:16S rRNA (cytidine1402-2'-O)-methyltransferase
MSKLYVVPTPIGNLEDMTFRAVDVLKKADMILAEDTRTSSKLMKHFDIDVPLTAYHQFNEHKVVDRLVEKIKGGTVMALISDAGTPAISDPGFLLVRECIKQEVEVETLPGPTAFVPALVNSGLPAEKFFFEGFLPHKKGRQTRLKFLADFPHTVILYESPHRLVKTLRQIAEYFGKERNISVSRELTKIHEENVRGTVEEVLKYFDGKTVKGEIVMVVEGKKL